MRYAIVSDIHANLQAWKSVLLDIRSLSVDRIVCLGDIVGYGPNPAEVLESVYAEVNHLVLGNHDAVICGKMDADLFTDDARDIILWTREQLSRGAVKFLKTLPLCVAGKGFRCTHGEFSSPASFDYVIDPEEALPSWRAVEEQLLFVGHSHCAGIFLVGGSGTPHLIQAQDFALEAEKRYLVNVGSVGQPRDGDPRASYCIYDAKAGSVHWRRIPFDIDAYRVSLSAAGLSDKPSCFLRDDPRLRAQPIREQLRFSPPRTREKQARDVVQVEQLDALKRDVKRWKIVATAIGLAALIVAVIAGGLWWRHTHRGAALRPADYGPLNAKTAPENTNLLAWPEGPVAAGQPIRGWLVCLGDRRRQQVDAVTSGSDEPAEGTRAILRLRSRTARDELALLSPPIRVAAGMRLSLGAYVRKADDFDGSVAVGLALLKAAEGMDERIEHFAEKTPNLPRQGGWLKAQETTDPLPAGSSEVRVYLRGTFTGSVDIRDVTLERR